MFPIPNFVSIGLAILCVVLGVMVASLRLTNSILSEENAGLTVKIGEVRAELNLQNKAVAELGAKTEEYKKKLGAAYTKNEESQKELKKKLKEIEDLKLPAECGGKIDVLREELIKEARGWKQ